MERVYPILAPYFGGFSFPVDLTTFTDGLEKLFDQDEKGLKDFAFKIFDVTNDKKLSQNDMFELMWYL